MIEYVIPPNTAITIEKMGENSFVFSAGELKLSANQEQLAQIVSRSRSHLASALPPDTRGRLTLGDPKA